MVQERQVAPTVDGIEKGHVARYRLATERIAMRQMAIRAGEHVVDCCCGVGYGVPILAEGTGQYVHGFDIDAGAIAYAKEHYRGPRVSFYEHEATVADPIMCFATSAVAFECIEHLREPERFLKLIGSGTHSHLIASVPNQAVFPWSERLIYHHRHYHAHQLALLLNACGWRVLNMWGQDQGGVPFLDGNRLATAGRYLIVECER